MKLSFYSLRWMVLMLLGLSFLLCCKKPPFKSGVGLYSVKQYHNYVILSPGDTGKLADARIGIISEDNNYLSWNSINFHISTTNDTLAVYIKDSVVIGVYQILYTLQYYTKTDHVLVIDNLNAKWWTSF